MGGPDHNPLPPACSPELIGGEGPDSRDGTQCPADKLVITPRQPIPAGTVAHVAISYSGTPGAHRTGEGSITGWMRTRGGNSMSSEPLGTEDWMPSNEVPSAKPTYDFTVTTQRGKTVIANGERTGIERNPPSKEFPRGSATTTWDAPFPIASYLPLTIVGDYSLRQRTGSATTRRSTATSAPGDGRATGR